ncbi:hypothetical protein ES332_D03G112500v1 [Gossypium tomentosum]|uniref:Uncharacterized protein n=1 Tax=Gossypium tomentosum TaxID=34277 RepID=A0A5D2LLG2_GOSTO|nr:hypothetical protein ES332_D03G112500v1 [Gossypium tomentosum]
MANLPHTIHDEEDQHNKESLNSKFNQTLKNVQGLLKGHNIRGKILLTRSDDIDKSVEGGVKNTNNSHGNITVSKLTSSTSKNEDVANVVQNSTMGTRATDSAMVTKLCELTWSAILLYMHPNVWRLLLQQFRAKKSACIIFDIQGYAPTNSDRREGVLKRKHLEYLDCVAQFYNPSAICVSFAMLGCMNMEDNPI